MRGVRRSGRIVGHEFERTPRGNHPLNFGREYPEKTNAGIRAMDMSIVFVMTVFVVGLTSIGYILEEPETASSRKKCPSSKG